MVKLFCLWGLKRKNVGSQDLLILQQILVLLWEENVLEARALTYSKYINGVKEKIQCWYFIVKYTYIYVCGIITFTKHQIFIKRNKRCHLVKPLRKSGCHF